MIVSLKIEVVAATVAVVVTTVVQILLGTKVVLWVCQRQHQSDDEIVQLGGGEEGV
jgi:hypothetical protein